MPQHLKADISFPSKQELLCFKESVSGYDLDSSSPVEQTVVPLYKSEFHSDPDSSPDSCSEPLYHETSTKKNIYDKDDTCEIKFIQCGRENLCGWGAIKPSFLQIFNTPKGVLFFLCVASFLQGMIVNGFINTVITSIERRFDLKSYHSGLIASSYDIAACVCLTFVSYFGGSGHKPRWLGWGVLIMGIGSIVFAMPHFTTDVYEVSLSEDTGICRSNQTHQSTEGASSLSIYRYVFMLGQFLHGIGATPLYTLGVTYLDENVKLSYSPVYIGIFYTAAIIGPAVGYLLGGFFLNIYTDFNSSTDLTPEAPLWVGAWWIGFLGAGAAAFLISFPILGYPQQLPGSQRYVVMRVSEAHQVKGGNQKTDPNFGKTIKDLPKVDLVVSDASWIAWYSLEMVFLGLDEVLHMFSSTEDTFLDMDEFSIETAEKRPFSNPRGDMEDRLGYKNILLDLLSTKLLEVEHEKHPDKHIKMTSKRLNKTEKMGGGKNTPVTSYFKQTQSDNLAEQNPEIRTPIEVTPMEPHTTDEDTPLTRADLHLLVSKQDITSSFDKLWAKMDAMHTSMNESLNYIKKDISDLGARVESLEENNDNIIEDVETAVQQTAQQQQVVNELLDKLEDMENRSRRCNIRLKGIPESITPTDLPSYLHQLFCAITGVNTSTVIEIERAHRALKPKPKADFPPRDVIVAFLRFPEKDKILRDAAKQPTFKFRGNVVHFFQDLSNRTLQRRGALRPLTTLLRKHQIQYRWGYPFALHISKDNKLLTIRDAEGIPDICDALGLDIPPTPGPSPSTETPKPQRIPMKSQRSHVLLEGTFNLSASCNADCRCLEEIFNPVCGADNVMYYSACYAGCSHMYIDLGDGRKVYENCSCIARNDSSSGGYAVAGKCSSSCYKMPTILLLIFSEIFFTFLCSVPAITATLRCVSDSQRSFALGIQWIVVRTLGAIPGPIAFGSMIDISCLLWQNQSTEKGSCYVYQNSDMSRYTLLAGLVYKALGSLFFLIALMIYNPPKCSSPDNLERSSSIIATDSRKTTEENNLVITSSKITS
ncbi:solute carrier organic anion transporter family member 4A1 [Bombina bombina]|uniref:solute carrier organic anion transporter family member 4A1 n=1 Tax=Bombina bombina TaxID=8345 RepID=UPI00235A54F7|nr:solute carrier organic anion transporter family member 4A1 [Bombina bombina]